MPLLGHSLGLPREEALLFFPVQEGFGKDGSGSGAGRVRRSHPSGGSTSFGTAPPKGRETRIRVQLRGEMECVDWIGRDTHRIVGGFGAVAAQRKPALRQRHVEFVGQVCEQVATTTPVVAIITSTTAKSTLFSFEPQRFAGPPQGFRGRGQLPSQYKVGQQGGGPSSSQASFVESAQKNKRRFCHEFPRL